MFKPKLSHFISFGAVAGTILAINCLAFTGRCFASGDGEAVLDVPKARTPVISKAEVRKAHNGQINDMAFSPDYKLLATAGRDGHIRIWDMATRKQQKTMTPRVNNPWAVQFSPDGKTLIVAVLDGMKRNSRPNDAMGETLHVTTWNVEKGQLGRKFQVPMTSIISFNVSPDGKWAVICGGDANDARFAILWDVKAGKLKRRLYTKSDDDKATGNDRLGPDEATFSPDSKTAAVATLAGKLLLWDVATGKVKKLGRGGYQLLYSPDGKSIASQDIFGNSSIALLDAKTGKDTRRIATDGSLVLGFDYSRDGKLLAAGDDSSSNITVWNPATGKELAVLKGHKEGVITVAFAASGRHLVSGGADGNLRIWNLTKLMPAIAPAAKAKTRRRRG